MILLDTHVLLWLTYDSDRLGPAARELIRENTGRIALSAMTFWELSMLQSKQRIELKMPIESLLTKVTEAGHIFIAPVSAEIAIDAHRLPDLHGDPVDRLLMATARDGNGILVTADHVIHKYAKAGHVQVVDARR